jgi:DNA-binding MarR family transcriptional regulator
MAKSIQHAERPKPAAASATTNGLRHQEKSANPGKPAARGSSGSPEGWLHASAIPPDDSRLREFVADLYAAMSMMRLLRHEIAASLSLTSAEYSVLLAVWYLERGRDITVRAIAGHLHVAAPNVTSEIARLVKKGLLTKTPDKLDRRAVEIGLTKASRAMLARLEPMLRIINRPLFAGMSYRDLTVVQRFLRNIIDHGHDAVRHAESFGSAPGLRGKAGTPQ